MHIPRFLMINKKRWRITQDAEALDTKKYNGMCLLDHQQILIDPALSRNDKDQTFIHELLHACWPGGLCSDRTEEKIIRELAVVLTPALINLMQANRQHEASQQKKTKRTKRKVKRSK